MYTWIWRRLPGGAATKLAGAALLVVAVVAVLFLVVFPWISPRLPFNHVTVDPPAPTHTPAPASSSAPGFRMS
jgi:hypothetical protein